MLLFGSGGRSLWANDRGVEHRKKSHGANLTIQQPLNLSETFYFHRHWRRRCPNWSKFLVCHSGISQIFFLDRIAVFANCGYFLREISSDFSRPFSLSSNQVFPPLLGWEHRTVFRKICDLSIYEIKTYPVNILVLASFISRALSISRSTIHPCQSS